MLVVVKSPGMLGRSSLPLLVPCGSAGPVSWQTLHTRVRGEHGSVRIYEGRTRAGKCELRGIGSSPLVLQRVPGRPTEVRSGACGEALNRAAAPASLGALPSLLSAGDRDSSPRGFGSRNHIHTCFPVVLPNVLSGPRTALPSVPGI